MVRRGGVATPAPEELYDKFMCYCKTTDADVTASIEAGATKTSELESAVEEDTATKA